MGGVRGVEYGRGSGGCALPAQAGAPPASFKGGGAHGDGVSTHVIPLARETTHHHLCRSRVNIAHTRQSRPDYGLGFHDLFFKLFPPCLPRRNIFFRKERSFSFVFQVGVPLSEAVLIFLFEKKCDEKTLRANAAISTRTRTRMSRRLCARM